MESMPRTLTADQAKRLIELLLEARTMLRDAAGSRIYEPNYAGASGRIAEALEQLGVDPG